MSDHQPFEAIASLLSLQARRGPPGFTGRFAATSRERSSNWGVGDACRALRMIEMAKQNCSPPDIHYVGMDLFEGRPGSDGPSISLKAAHQMLRAHGRPSRAACARQPA